MISIQATDLHRMLQQVTPHMSDDDCTPVINSVRLETRCGWLYVAATDRYTFAVARREVAASWDRDGHLPGHLVPAVMAWLNSEATAGHTVGLTLPVTEDSPVILTAPKNNALHLEYDASHYKNFPDWRKIFRHALTATPEAIPLTGFTTRYLNRWQHAAEKLVTWQEAPGKPLVLLDELGTFAGLHMPVGYHRDLTRDGVASGWIGATAPTATVDGLTYDLSRTWVDRHGDPWSFAGEHCPDGMPLMVLDGIEDDPHPLDQLIAQYGPIYSA
ncbi:phiSA1p31-related protein [Streptomyces sp. NPDC014806]|uniref:phiSA1p31-related protein n=1 Tax=Streptomyces sp. NPDC014806 TaxID=3364920 RepID=UPI0036F9A149